MALLFLSCFSLNNNAGIIQQYKYQYFYMSSLSFGEAIVIIKIMMTKNIVHFFLNVLFLLLFSSRRRRCCIFLRFLFPVQATQRNQSLISSNQIIRLCSITKTKHCNIARIARYYCADVQKEKMKKLILQAGKTAAEFVWRQNREK